MIPIGTNVLLRNGPVVVWGLIGLNVAAFIVQLTLDQAATQRFLMEWALVPRRYFFWDWARSQGLSPTDFTPFITNMFLHGGFLHIGFNLWTLYVFGPALEDRLGPSRFLGLYLVSGLAAGAAHAVFNASSPIPALGASGAIAGVIAAYAIRFPYAWINVVLPIGIVPVFFSVPALLFAGGWFSLQILQGTTELLSPSMGGGIAWWAHIGGFLAGWALLKPLDRLGRGGKPPSPW